MFFISYNIKVLIAITFFTLLQVLPAAVNGFPFLFFDTRGYFGAGEAVIDVAFGTTVEEILPPESMAQGASVEATTQEQNSTEISMSRSPFYGAVLYLSWIIDPFLVVFLQSLIVAVLAWLVCLHVCVRSPFIVYGISAVVCALLTPLPYFAGYAMPDVFAGLVPISFFLLCYNDSKFGWQTMGFVWIVLVAAITFHSSLILLSFGLIIAISTLSIWPYFRPSLRGWLGASSALITGLMGVFAFAYIALLVFGSWPANAPFLTARGIEDGPVAELIAEDCGDKDFAICGAAPLRSTSSQQFLWGKEGFYQTADAETKLRLSQEDFAVFFSAAKEHPVEQLTASLGNFVEQFSMIGLYDFYTAERVFAESAANYLSNANLQKFGDSLAVNNIYPFAWISLFVYVSAILSLMLLIYSMYRGVLPKNTLVLIIIVFIALIGNAMIGGVLSDPHHRYQARMIWLLPFLATLISFQPFMSKRS
ncbi:MAG: hypothetical protein JKY41_12880 [Rhodobacteraceae bacterium]|nr:hypothetical protein [Paracoccaceae bacterium]